MQSYSSYIPIDLHTVPQDKKMSFDVFHKTLDGRMEFYCTTEKCAEDGIFERIRNSYNPCLYIKMNNLPDYICYLQENAKIVLEDKNTSLEKKVKYASALITYTEKNIFKNPLKEEIVKFKKIISFTLNNLLFEDNALKELIKLSNSEFTLANHNVNVGFIGIGLAEKIFGAGQKETLSEIAAGFFLHDIGKLSISRDILLKSGNLNSAEWEIMKKHPEAGCKMLYDWGILSNEMEKIILQHHERRDGSGYPRGLKGKDIHIFAKICSIADSYDALTSKRPYRDKCSPFDALLKLKKELFDNFEPEFYSCFLNLLRGT